MDHGSISDNEISLFLHNHQAPEHVAIIMDGNRRWAKQHNLPAIAGHKKGVESLKKIVRFAAKLNVDYLTVWAFSTDNWKRSKLDVDSLMTLMNHVLENELEELAANNIRLKFIGQITQLSNSLQKNILQAEAETAKNDKMTLVIALNYSSRDDIVNAARLLSSQVLAGSIQQENITSQMLSSSLSTHFMKNPDLVIRTSGELRLSNFMLWELAYAELYFCDTLWPDFDEHNFFQAVKNYAARLRRFGE